MSPYTQQEWQDDYEDEPISLVPRTVTEDEVAHAIRVRTIPSPPTCSAAARKQ